jgi:hypothetical protein
MRKLLIATIVAVALGGAALISHVALVNAQRSDWHQTPSSNPAPDYCWVR